MSRSRRKSRFGSWTGAGSMKLWRQEVNQRNRHRSKQLINTCKDWDKLILPTKHETGNLYDSPVDGRKHFLELPLINDCEFEAFEYRMRWGRESVWKFSKHYKRTGHFKTCNCYDNKRSWYWKMLRK